jgi:tRNA (adenine57-N1/adenine58-N1)-methyltransferase
MPSIKEGDHVLLFLDPARKYLIKVGADRVFHTHKGFIKHEDLIGRDYGERVKSSLGTEFVLLKPSIEDYATRLARPTQIAYPKDVGLIVLRTGISSGSRVVEAGTGSGALTSYLAHLVKPTGRVYSYEVRKEFIDIAKRNLKKAGVLDYVELKNEDITKGIEEEEVDAVVLDLAMPWSVVPHAHKALKGGRFLASLSPTIDQVVKMTEALEQARFVDVETVESLVRRYQVKKGRTRPEMRMIGHTCYVTFARKAI